MVIIMRYDIAIVGSGPAGLSAAINAKIRNKNIIVFGTENLSNKLEKAPEINNYFLALGEKAIRHGFADNRNPVAARQILIAENMPILNF